MISSYKIKTLTNKQITSVVYFRYKNLQQGNNSVRQEEWKNIWIPDVVIDNSKDEAHTAYR